MKFFKPLLAASLFAFASLGWAGTVNLNSADEKTLETLPGIGPSKAAAIVEYRKQNGGFKSVDDLSKVEGIGDKTLDALRDQVTVGGGVAKPAAAKAAAVKK